MVRIGAISLLVVSLFVLFGCKTTETQPTGLELSFGHCISFEAWVWVDNDYFGSFTSDIPSFLDINKTGAHTLYAKSNLVTGDTCFCWTQGFSITEGKTTPLKLDCANHGCCKLPTSAALR